MNFEHWQNGELPPLGEGPDGGNLENWQNAELTVLGIGTVGVASGTDRVTLVGAYVEIGGAAEAVTLVGAYVEIGHTERVTLVGAYVEIAIPARPQPSVHRRPRFYATVQRPDFSQLNNKAFTFKPIRWSWRRPGGCYQAEIEVYGRRRDVWNALPGLLRSPVTIYNNNHSKTWWGFVNDIELYSDNLTMGISLDRMFNGVTLSYNQTEAGETTGIGAFTTYATDDDSRNRFGQKDIVASYGNATSAQADLIRDGYLAKLRYITPDVRAGGVSTASTSSAAEQLSGKLICRGWWDTLGWRYYDNAGTDEVDISLQLAAIEASVGEFFEGTDILSTVDLGTNEYRDGTQTALQIVEELLLVPGSVGEFFTAWVTPDRFIRFDEEHASAITDWLLMPDGSFRTFVNGIPDPGVEIVGSTQLRGVLPTANWGYLISPTPLYIEENEFDADSLRYNWRARAARSPWG